MRACHFQDVPGKRSICLRSLEIGPEIEIKATRWKICASSDECPHRGWDYARRAVITRARSHVLGVCYVCGRRHDLVAERLECLFKERIGHVITEMEEPQGSTEPLLANYFPKNMKDRAWRAVRKAVVKRDGHACRECGRDLGEYPSWYTEVHHIVAVIDGGSDHPSNLVTLCVECHGARTDDMCKRRPTVRDNTSRGNSHRKKRTMSQSVLD